MSDTVINRDDVVIDFGNLQLAGVLEHDETRHTLVLLTEEGAEHISTDLSAYGLVPAPGHVFVKDWSEHDGLTASLERVGLARKVNEHFVGPFRSRAFEVEVTL